MNFKIKTTIRLLFILSALTATGYLSAVTVETGVQDNTSMAASTTADTPLIDRYIMYSGQYSEASLPLVVTMILDRGNVYLKHFNVNKLDLISEGTDGISYLGEYYEDIAGSDTITSGDSITEITQEIYTVPAAATVPAAVTCNPYVGTSKAAVSGLLTSLENIYAENDEGTFFEKVKRRYDAIGRTFGIAEDQRARLVALRALVNGCPEQ